MNLHTVPATLSPTKMRRLMHIPNEMDQKLQHHLSLFHPIERSNKPSLLPRINANLFDELLQQTGYVLDRTQDIVALASSPSPVSWKHAGFGWMIVECGWTSA